MEKVYLIFFAILTFLQFKGTIEGNIPTNLQRANNATFKFIMDEIIRSLRLQNDTDTRERIRRHLPQECIGRAINVVAAEAQGELAYFKELLRSEGIRIPPFLNRVFTRNCIEIAPNNTKGLEEYVRHSSQSGNWNSGRQPEILKKTCRRNYELKVAPAECEGIEITRRDIHYQHLDGVAPLSAEVLSCSCIVDANHEIIHMTELTHIYPNSSNYYSYIHLDQISENTYRITRGWLFRN